MSTGRPCRSEAAANLSMLASSATIGAHAFTPSRRPVTRAPIPATRPGFFAAVLAMLFL